MMTAWRIENPEDGKGPYRLGGPELEKNYTRRTPPHGREHVLIDEQRVPRDRVFYACESVEQLCEWFTIAERERCAEAGYIMALYHVEPEAWVPGDRHVCFDAERAARVEEHPIPLIGGRCYGQGTDRASTGEVLAMLTVAAFVAQHGITLTARRASRNPNMSDAQEMDHWHVTLKAGEQGVSYRELVTYFSMGYGHYGKAPDAASVLDCLASDAAAIENARGFDDWAAEYGYDPDSRSAERAYRVCKAQTDKLRAFLSPSRYAALLWETEGII